MHGNDQKKIMNMKNGKGNELININNQSSMVSENRK